MERRIAAVFAADMVGFSRLIERDEVGTLERQKRHLQELIEPTITAKKGRIVKLTGDGLIAEFSSVVEAVQCAVSVQAEMAAREEDFPEDEKIQYRVAVHLGDVVFDDGDVYGDGVNVAARLEGLAAPGGVVVSGTAYDVLKANVDVAYKSLGEQQLKNIATPVRVYQVVEGAPIAPATRTPKRVPWVVAAVVVVAMLGGLFWWQQQPDFEPLNPEELAFALPDKPSIAVLPFENLSDRQDDQYLADGFIDTLITELMSLQDLVVIAKNSSFSFRDKQLLNSTIAEQLGVRYLLEGSFQHQGGNLRINARLMDAVEGKQVWSKRYDRDASKFVSLQDDLVTDLVLEIGGRAGGGIFKAERERVSQIPNDELEILELWEKSTQVFLRFTKEGNQETRRLSEEMISRYPDHPRGYLSLAWYHIGKAIVGVPHDGSEVIDQCTKLANQAISLAPNDYMAYMLRAYCSSRAGEPEAAKAWAERSFELNRNDILVQRDYARFVLIPESKFDEAIDTLERNLRLNPMQQANLNATLGELYVIVGRYEEAVEQLRKEAVRSKLTEARTAAALYLNGRIGEASDVVDRLRASSPDYAVETFLATARWIPDEALERFAQALKASGLPESSKSEPEEALDPQSDKPSVAVLPFENLSRDPDQEYFADGMTDDLIVRLAKVDGLFVISRNTAFTYKGKSVRAKDLGRDLNVRYVIEGSVRREGSRVRINAQLVDAGSDSSVWAETFDRETAELFELQDEITTEIVEALKLKLDASDLPRTAAEGPKDLEAYNLYLKGMSELRQRRPEAFARAKVFLDDALEIDPDYVEAHAALAFLYWESQQHGWLSHIRIENTTEAFVLVEQHLEMTRNSPTPVAHLVRSEWLSDMNRDSEGAISEARLAVKLDPSFAEAYVGLAGRLALAGETEEALRMTDEALRLDPVTPPDYHVTVGLAHVIDGDYEEAVIALETAVKDGSSKNFPWVLLAAAYGHQGRLEDAEMALAAIERNNKRSGLPPFFANHILQWAIHELAVRERIFEDLKNAGARYRDAMLVGGQAKRQLTGEEIQDLVISTTGKGVMVGPAGTKNDFTWTVDPEAKMNFHLFGQIFETQMAFFDDRACNERGCSYYFELTDSEAVKWGHRYVIEEQTGLLYYFTTKPLTEVQE
ncbi:MAG: adenylate/guanylate cyclase domain-containing protein [Arenibacterium sp.]